MEVTISTRLAIRLRVVQLDDDRFGVGVFDRRFGAWLLFVSPRGYETAATMQSRLHEGLQDAISIDLERLPRIERVRGAGGLVRYRVRGFFGSW